MIGQSISHYNILEKLGEGGMGVVYKARDLHLDRFVAIKVLAPGRVADEERHRRFILEAKAASALSHPNIVTIHDIDSEEGTHFIVMESALETPLLPQSALEACRSAKRSITPWRSPARSPRHIRPASSTGI